MIKNTTESYGSLSKGLHWGLAVLVVGLLIVGLYMTGIEDKATKGFVVNIHKSTGMLVLALVAFRFIWRLINPTPRSLSHSIWEKIAETSMHWILYILLFAIPITGWLMATAARKMPAFYGTFQLPNFPMIEHSRELAKNFAGIHEALAWVLIGLLCIHIAAAVKHHVVNKDDVMRRMM